MDIPVKFLLDNLANLLRYHYDLISNAKSDVDKLNNELRMLRAIVKTAPGKYKKDDIFKEWERQVRGAVYDVEDAIDTYITDVAMEKGKSFIKKGVSRINRANLVKSLRDSTGKITALKDHKTFNHFSGAETLDTGAADTKQIREQRRQNKIIGVQDQADTLIRCLNEQVDRLDVVSIIGMPGLGKTTVAWKIFQDPGIEYEFPTRIWVNISDDLNLNRVLRTIVSHFTSQEQAEHTPDDKLRDKVKEHLQSGKYLIVMDDVWSNEAWDNLRYILPTNNNQGKILITSRFSTVAFHANINRKPHKLRFLSKQESWELLQYEVYDKECAVHADLVEVGQLISERCDGLPLSIVVIGGILKGKIAEAGGVVPSIRRQWEEVSIRMQQYLVDQEDKTKRLQKIISLSYEKLPYELRDCFLYLGVFPEDADVSAKKLTLLWIAEGFVQGADGKSLEETARDNLRDLISRNLLMVEKEKFHNGEVKVCRVHDTIRQFCKTEAKFDNLNLFQEISWTNAGVFEPSPEIAGQHRRLCIHSYIHDFISKNPKLPNARTFLCSSKSAINLDAKEITPFTQAFHLVRVLDAKDIKFPKFPQKLTNLIHLRYLTLTFTNDQVKFLPEAMSNLWNLQTLIVETVGRTLDIKADILNMRHLRHFKTKASIVLKKDGKGEGGDNLQTLERLSPGSCTDTVFKKARNLVKLGIQGNLSSLATMYHKSLKELGRLKKLKLVHRAESKTSPCRLPKAIEFPSNLRTLVLVSTNLDWGQMSVLADPVHLEVLKLKENAFTGESWEAFKYSFMHLELLDIERADVKRWATSEECFPKLRSLVLKNCEGLEEVPPVLGKLEMLSLERVTESAVTSAENIKARKGADFVLNIAPADKMKKALSLKSQTPSGEEAL